MCVCIHVGSHTLGSDPLFLLYLSYGSNVQVLLNNKNPYCAINTEKELLGAVLSGINLKGHGA